MSLSEGYIKWFAAFAIIIVAVFVSLKIISPEFLSFSKSSNPFPKGTVALINDQEIKGEVFNARFDQIKLLYAGQVGEINNENLEEIKNITIREVINEILVMMYAENENIKAEQAEVDFHYNEIKSTVPAEDFEKELSEWGFTPNSFREEITKQLLIEKAVNHYAGESLEVREDEIREAFLEYGQYFGDELDYDEVKDDLRLMIERDKFSSAVERLIDHLRTENAVEVL